jgi:tetratricopeptide (TPR) repeat protein
VGGHRQLEAALRSTNINALQQKALRQKKKGQFEAAKKSLAEAIQAAAALLADLEGTLGGVLREQGRYQEAVNQYDRGYRIDETYGIVSSYNALNRLVTRLLARGAPAGTKPAPRRAPTKTSKVDMHEELRKVHTMIEGRLGKDQPPDYWAAGDFGLVSALMADEPGMKKGLALFTAPSTPAYAYDAYLNMLAKLLEVELPQSSQLRQLRQRLKRAKASAPAS